MQYSVGSTLPARFSNNCLILGINASGKLFSGALVLDKLTSDYCRTIAKRGDIDGTVGSTLLLHDVPGLKVDRVLLAGIGDTTQLSSTDFRRLSSAITKAIHTTGAQAAASVLTDLTVDDQNLRWKVRVPCT